jgi:hypothetical protein
MSGFHDLLKLKPASLIHVVMKKSQFDAFPDEGVQMFGF